MIKGEKVALRAIEREDLPKIWEWLNDEEVMYYWSMPGITVSLAELEHHFSRSAETKEPGRRWFTIETRDRLPIGIIAYFDLRERHHRAEIAIIIGDKEYWGKGYGADAIMALLRFLFNELGLNRVHLRVAEFNTRAIKCYEKCGFAKEGTLRQWFFVEGRYHDGFLMSILRQEFGRGRTAH